LVRVRVRAVLEIEKTLTCAVLLPFHFSQDTHSSLPFSASSSASDSGSPALTSIHLSLSLFISTLQRFANTT